MKRLTNKGFSMIELLVVLLIIGILAAVAAPLYLAHTTRARASEAVATMGLIRQAEREYFTKHGGYLAVAAGSMANDPEAAANPGLGIDAGAAQYFSTPAYSVVVNNAAFTDGTATANFIITADGAASTQYLNGAGARNFAQVATMKLEMDNSGLTKLGAGSGNPLVFTWTTY